MKWLKLFEEFDIGGLSTNFGRGKTFTEKCRKDYESLKKDPKVFWGVYDIDNDVFIDKSPNYRTLIEGASVPKSVAAAASLVNNGGKLTSKDHSRFLKGLLVNSVNGFWKPIQKLAGGGENLDRWCQKMGWSNMTPSTTPGNRRINVEGMCLFWADTLNNKYPGAKIIERVSNGVVTSFPRSRVYIPKDCKIGTKTGTWNTSTGDMHDSGWVILANGRRFSITVLTKLFDPEKIALMWGGIYEEYIKNKKKDLRDWQPKSGVMYIPVEGRGKATSAGFIHTNYPWIGLPDNLVGRKDLRTDLKFLILKPGNGVDFEDLLEFVEDGYLDYLRNNTIIDILWGEKFDMSAFNADIDDVKKHIGITSRVLPLDKEEMKKVNYLLRDNI